MRREKHSTAPNTGKRQTRMAMTFDWGAWGFELKARSVLAIVSRGDVGVTVGSYGLAAMWGHAPIPGVHLERPSGNRHWHWDEVRSWFTRKPLASLDAV
jgi:hypothetical protein